ncbi:hypothetical protein SY83_00815 [Paenibacillus swuensis]|uniref:Uncharacterized protein n=1 Tax=Paenibacillus swuensis TaxID=1178515 RepID=A0A172TNI8_9BACL|nr:hypothetical protein [Paenibacillus swuensis]ANE48621.1 hypothetical protein SY83_00815 [Paenibacillus swuensis]
MDRDIILARAGLEQESHQLKREQDLFTAFARFMYNYLQSKKELQEGHLLDAYSSSIKALHHWATTEVMEQGGVPERTVWKQVRKINPGIYKLYEELTESTETLELRVQLITLACEFSVTSKLKQRCGYLLDLMNTSEHPWSLEELASHPQLSDVKNELPYLLPKLVHKSLVREVSILTESDWMNLELSYKTVG